MARGDILLVSGGKDWAARIIVAVTRSPIHHAAIDLGDGTCISAEFNGVQRKSISDFAHVETVSPGTVEQRNLVAWLAEKHIGQPYNKAAFILAGLNALHLIPSILAQPLADLADGHGVICSSLVDTCYLAAGIDLFPGPEAFTWPGELGTLLNDDDGRTVPQAA